MTIPGQRGRGDHNRGRGLPQSTYASPRGRGGWPGSLLARERTLYFPTRNPTVINAPTPVTTQQPLPGISTSPTTGQKHNLDQTVEIVESNPKRERLSDIEDDSSRTKSPLKAVKQAEITKNALGQQRIDTTKLNMLAIDIVTGLWKAAGGALSSVEKEQNQARKSYRSAIEDVKIMGRHMSSDLSVSPPEQTLLVSRLETLLFDLELQSVFSHLKTARTDIALLSDQAQLPTARFLAKSIVYRLNRKSYLRFDFDLDQDLPGARVLMVQEEKALDFLPLQHTSAD